MAEAALGVKRVIKPLLQRPILALGILSTLFLVVRSVVIADAHSESYDMAAFFDRGLRFLEGTAGSIAFNDPPFGHGLLVLPFWLIGCKPMEGPILYLQPISVEAILLVMAAWKALLFVPTVLIVFAWARRLYGDAAGWFSAALLLAEPNFAGAVPVGMLDSLAVTACVAMAFCWWRFFEKQSVGRLMLASAMLALAMSIKFNAASIALSIAVYAVLWWGHAWRVTWREWVFTRAGACALAALLLVLGIWALTLLDVGRPVEARTKSGAVVLHIEQELPAAEYLAAFAAGYQHNAAGHPSFYMGEARTQGIWSYFPVLASYKVPLGIGLVLLVAGRSLAWRRGRWDELSCVVPLSVGALFMLGVNINSGFRHALPVYVFVLVLAGRCLAAPDGERTGRLRTASGIAWIGLAATLLHAISYHPDYLVYMNYPRQAAYLDFSDTNVDWGQGLKQVATYLKSRPADGRPVYLRYHGSGRAKVRHYVGDDVVVQRFDDPAATSGVLIISPCSVAGFFRDTSYVHLKRYRPDAVIGHTMLVFDLDRLREW